MRATSTFRVTEFVPTSYTPDVTTALPTGHVHMIKEFDGAMSGRSVTQFSYAYDDARGGSYVAIESFDGSVDGRTGTFNFIHSSTQAPDGQRTHEFLHVVPGSGTDKLAGIRGQGRIRNEDDTDRLVLDYDLD